MNPWKLTGFPKSSKFYVFIRSHLLLYKIIYFMCNQDLFACICDTLLLKILSEKTLNSMWSKQKYRVKYRVKYASKKVNENWRHTCLDGWQRPVIIKNNNRFQRKKSTYQDRLRQRKEQIWKHWRNLCVKSTQIDRQGRMCTFRRLLH